MLNILEQEDDRKSRIQRNMGKSVSGMRRPGFES